MLLLPITSADLVSFLLFEEDMEKMEKITGTVGGREGLSYR